MINFSENYNRKNFQIFLKDFLPNDYVQQIEGIEIDEKNNYFQKINLLGFVKSLNNLVIIEAERKKPEKSRIIIAKELFKFLEYLISEKNRHSSYNIFGPPVNAPAQYRIPIYMTRQSHALYKALKQAKRSNI